LIKSVCRISEDDFCTVRQMRSLDRVILQLRKPGHSYDRPFAGMGLSTIDNSAGIQKDLI